MSEEARNPEKEHADLLERIASGMRLFDVVDDGLREKWAALIGATVDMERLERMAESLLLTHYALA